MAELAETGERFSLHQDFFAGTLSAIARYLVLSKVRLPMPVRQ